MKRWQEYSTDQLRGQPVEPGEIMWVVTRSTRVKRTLRKTLKIAALDRFIGKPKRYQKTKENTSYKHTEI